MRPSCFKPTYTFRQEVKQALPDRPQTPCASASDVHVFSFQVPTLQLCPETCILQEQGSVDLEIFIFGPRVSSSLGRTEEGVPESGSGCAEGTQLGFEATRPPKTTRARENHFNRIRPVKARAP